jgi:acetyl esterase/lipase
MVDSAIIGNAMMQKMTCLLLWICLAIPAGFGNEPVMKVLWPDGVPDSAIVHTEQETSKNRESQANLDGLNRAVSFVSVPGLYVYPAPPDINTGVAVVIFPGGGYRHLAIDKEGHDVARRLNQDGIAAVVVKYRLCPSHIQSRLFDIPQPILDAFLADGLRAVRMVRLHAEEWGMDPQKIGVMGFSAGGHLALRVATEYDTGHSQATDPVEQISSRPNFAAPIYPAVPRTIKSNLYPTTPPMFIVNADDDRTTPAMHSASLYLLLKHHGVKAGMHIYAAGGHGFGIGVNGGDVLTWPSHFIEWLREMAFIQK